MESSNPALNNKAIAQAKVIGAPTMTVQGTVNKTLVLFLVLLATAMWSWSKTFDPAGLPTMITLGQVAGLAGFLLALATIFRPAWAPTTSPIYAACEGVLLGAFSAVLERKFPGIAVQAVGLTFAVLGAMLLGYKTKVFQATPALTKGIVVATAGIAIFYLVVMAAGFFGINPPGFLSQGTPLGIAFSLFVVGIAAFNLILNFSFIEQFEREGMAKYMEWYGGFSLMLTLVWLYIEMLTLLSKINNRN